MSSDEEKALYVRVSTVLYPFSGLSSVPKDIVDNAARRGQKAHDACEGIMQGFGEIGVDAEIRKYVDSFNLWWEKGHEIISIEERFWDDGLKLTGKVDCIEKIGEGFAVVDLKTSYQESKTWRAQGCAYAMLAKQAGYDIRDIIFLHLKKDGSEPKLYHYAVDDDFFLSVLTTWNHFYKGKNGKSNCS
jgi:hypothetical protein